MVQEEEAVDPNLGVLSNITGAENNDEDNAADDDEEVNTAANSSESFAIPSAVIGVQIQ